MSGLHSKAERLLRRFRRTDQGAMAPLLGLLMLILIGFMGFAIDVGRSVLVHARLVDALDAAGLAVGARLSTTNYTEDAKRFVSANFKTNYVQATVTDVTATPNAAKNVIALTATATMPTAFMKLFGTDFVQVKATSEVTRSSTGLELVMVLDNTGSMEQSNSMPTLISSAKDLLDIVFGNQTTADNLYVGLVPFSHTVNIGVTTLRQSWMNLTHGATVTGCVEERENGADQTDAPPTTTATRFKDYFYPYQGGNLISYYLNKGWTKYCPSELTPMTNVKSKVVSGIDAMTATGNTHINVGAVWGWRMLSPKWRGLWDGDMLLKGLPLEYGTKNMSKAVIIMTDGDNTMSGPKNNNPGIYTAYGMLSDGRLNTTNDELKAKTELDNRLTAVCSNMKLQGIIVYSVAFDNPEPATKTLLQNCATSTSYYFDAGDKKALNAAFRTIGDSLSNLRVSK